MLANENAIQTIVRKPSIGGQNLNQVSHVEQVYDGIHTLPK